MNQLTRTVTIRKLTRLAMFVALCLSTSFSGCVGSEPERWASPADFPTLRVRVDNETAISQVDTEEEAELRQMVWEYAHAGDLAGKKVGEYNTLRSEMQSHPYVAINSSGFVKLKNGTDSVLVYFILVSLVQQEERPDGVICDAIKCTEIGSARSIDNLTLAARRYMGE